jgi:hypothetical protein
MDGITENSNQSGIVSLRQRLAAQIILRPFRQWHDMREAL